MAIIKTVSLIDLKVVNIEVQAYIAQGLPCFIIVGMPEKVVTEAKERIKTVFNALGIKLPLGKIIVNLSPTDIPKYGNHYDLPIALCILMVIQKLQLPALEQYIVIGELSLHGQIKHVDKGLLFALHAKKEQYGIICSQETASVAFASGNNMIIAAEYLQELLYIFSHETIQHYRGNFSVSTLYAQESLCYSDIVGQKIAKRAALISAAGHHHMLMLGPSGCGKSMIAKRLVTLLPKCTITEMLEITKIHILANKEDKIIMNVPYQAPHHTSSYVSLIGGGQKALPGLISLANLGVLFMDEILEFSREVMEALRQPIEDKIITINRINNRMTYDCNIMLIAASNFCKCGKTMSMSDTCSKYPSCSRDYLNKMSKPLLDRIDICVTMSSVSLSDLEAQYSNKDKKEFTSTELAKKVQIARQIQRNRNPNGVFNADLDSQYILQHYRSNINIFSHKLSMRSYIKIIRLARSIADLDQSIQIKSMHIDEALFYHSTINTMFSNN